MIMKYLKWRADLWALKRDVCWYDIFFIHADILAMGLLELLHKDNGSGK